MSGGGEVGEVVRLRKIDGVLQQINGSLVPEQTVEVSEAIVVQPFLSTSKWVTIVAVAVGVIVAGTVIGLRSQPEFSGQGGVCSDTSDCKLPLKCCAAWHGDSDNGTLCDVTPHTHEEMLQFPDSNGTCVSFSVIWRDGDVSLLYISY